VEAGAPYIFSEYVLGVSHAGHGTLIVVYVNFGVDSYVHNVVLLNIQFR
jgi:hypothetical protein